MLRHKSVDHISSLGTKLLSFDCFGPVLPWWISIANDPSFGWLSSDASLSISQS